MKSIARIASALLLAASLSAQPMARAGNGDRVEGRALFTKLRCDSCHALSGQGRKVPHPLPDLTAQPPDAVANMIVERGELAPGMLFDEMAMSSAVAQMQPQDLAHLVAYLRHPSARSNSE
jgi:cytochrome c553